MSTGLDSYAAFEARAIKIGLEPEVIKLLKDGGVNSFGSYAFVTAYQPGQGDEQPLVDSLKTIMKRAPTATEMIGLRRLFFESCTLALSELQQRSENNSNPEPSKMPIAERNSRLALQRDRLKGVHFSTETEPSHKLADLVNQFAIDQSVEWLPWEKLTSRSSEITHSEKDLRISFDSSGNLKLAPKESANEAPVNGEMRIRQALARRARAFDLAELCSFTKMEEWHEKLFEAYQREPLPNAMPLSLSQLREADKVLFRKLAEKTRGSLVQKADGTKPMEAAMDDLMNCAEVQFCLIPMVKQSQAPSTSFEHSSPKGKGKTKSPNKPKNDFQQKHAGDIICVGSALSLCPMPVATTEDPWSNKPERLEKIRELLVDLKKGGKVTKRQAQVIHGNLNFAMGFCMGHTLKIAARAFASLSAGDQNVSPKALNNLCDWTLDLLKLLNPREWTAGMTGDPVVIFTDAAYEDGVATYGIVFLDAPAGYRTALGGRIPDFLVNVWHELGSEQVITLAEAFAALLARYLFRSRILKRRLLVFIDNEGARHTLIKASSHTLALLQIAQLFNSCSEYDFALAWIER
ncbi:unnamed protein product, partial [Durusdinium trenchii]